MNLKKRIRITLTGALLASGALLFAASSQAGLITYDLSGDYDDEVASLVLTEGGVTLTADNFSTSLLSLMDFDGLCFAGSGQDFAFCPAISSFDLTFSQPVRLISYLVGYLTDSSSGGNASTVEILFSQDGNTSTETNFVDVASTDFANQFVVAGNQALSVNASHFTGGYDSIQFRQLVVATVDSQVPVPATVGLLVLGLAGLRYSRRRKVR